MQALAIGHCWSQASLGFRVAAGLAALACLLGCAQLEAPSPMPDERASFMRGVEALEREAAEQAIQQFNAALRQDDADAYAYMGLGLAHLQRGQYEEAFGHYEQAIRLGSKPVQALLYRERGSVKTELERYQEALADFDASLRIQARSDAYSGKSFVHFMLGNHAEAFATINQAIDMAPNHPELYFFRGVYRQELGCYREAIDDYDRVLSLVPGFSEASDNRALAQAALRQGFSTSQINCATV